MVNGQNPMSVTRRYNVGIASVSGAETGPLTMRAAGNR